MNMLSTLRTVICLVLSESNRARRSNDSKSNVLFQRRWAATLIDNCYFATKYPIIPRRPFSPPLEVLLRIEIILRRAILSRRTFSRTHSGKPEISFCV